MASDDQDAGEAEHLRLLPPNMELHVLPALGHRALQQITAPMLNALYADLLDRGQRAAGGLSPKTVRYIHTTIHKALADAVDAGRARDQRRRAREAATTLDGRERGRCGSGQPERAPRTSSSSSRGSRLEAAWHLAAMTGMRRGEVLGLRWRDVDLDAARLSVRQTIVSVAYEVPISTPKTHQARVIDLDPATVEQLRAHRERQQLEREEWGADYEDSDLVFCRENGAPLHPDSVHPDVRASDREDRACRGSDFTTCATRTRRSRCGPASPSR